MTSNSKQKYRTEFAYLLGRDPAGRYRPLCAKLPEIKLHGLRSLHKYTRGSAQFAQITRSAQFA